MCAQNFELKELKPYDWAIYRAIILDAIEHEPSSFTSIYEHLSQLSGAEWKKKLTIGSRCIIALIDSGVAQGIVVGSWGRENTAPNEASIEMLYVSKRYRSQGGARSLLKTAIETIKNQSDSAIITIQVNSNIQEAIQFYLKHKFTITDTGAQIMSDGSKCTVNIMQRSI